MKPIMVDGKRNSSKCKRSPICNNNNSPIPSLRAHKKRNIHECQRRAMLTGPYHNQISLGMFVSWNSLFRQPRISPFYRPQFRPKSTTECDSSCSYYFIQSGRSFGSTRSDSACKFVIVKKSDSYNHCATDQNDSQPEWCGARSAVKRPRKSEQEQEQE